MNHPAPPSQWRSRLVLLLIVAMFFGSFGVAAFLRFTGWTPEHTRNFGELLEPPIDVNGVNLLLADDTRWAWKNDERRWTVLLRLPAQCSAECWNRAAMLPRVRMAMGRHSPRLPLLLLDAALPAEQRERLQPLQPARAGTALPSALASPPQSLPELWLVDPHGFVVLHYAEGFDPNGLRKDLGRVLK
ncbi:hypothetical protein [Arenimonas sp.]|uniref:hypothetical protein n=1 Tax=Arenimonas sp. TaxID=1872635 RepID=UPI0039E25F07